LPSEADPNLKAGATGAVEEKTTQQKALINVDLAYFETPQ